MSIIDQMRRDWRRTCVAPMLLTDSIEETAETGPALHKWEEEAKAYYLGAAEYMAFMRASELGRSTFYGKPVYRVGEDCHYQVVYER